MFVILAASRTRYLGMVLLLGVVGSVCHAQKAASFAGRWQGGIEVPKAGGLDFNIDLGRDADGKWKGDISIPAQGLRNKPLEGLRIEGRGIEFSIPGVPGGPSFKGILAESNLRIDGEFTQAGRKLPFLLERQVSRAQAARLSLADFRPFVERVLKIWKVPGFAMAVVCDGVVVFEQGFGMRDAERKLPVTPKTLFAIGSTTKAFTTFVMGTLVDEGKLQWDKPVRTWIPEFKLKNESTARMLTPRDLVTHRSGLPRHDVVWYNNNEITRGEIVQRLAHLDPSEDLRAKFQYNNLMYVTAGHLLERITGSSWEEKVRERILEPLGMKDTNFSVLEMQKTYDYAVPYSQIDDKVTRIPFRRIDLVGPAGSINSSLGDMTRWLTVNLQKGKFGDRQLIKVETLADIHSPHMAMGGKQRTKEITPASYGLGWMIDTYRGHVRWHHGGGIDGFVAQVTLFPDDGVGVVAFMNRDGAGIPEVLTRCAADRLFDLDLIDWSGRALKRFIKTRDTKRAAEEAQAGLRRTGTRPGHELNEYAGTYHHPGYGDVRISNQDGRLVLSFNGLKAILAHWHFEVFRTEKFESDTSLERQRVRFDTDMDGNIATLTARLEQKVDAIVFEKKADARLSDPKYISRFVGNYEHDGKLVVVVMKGDHLTLRVAGQPTYDLVPSIGNRFSLAKMPGFKVSFAVEGQKVSACIFSQPNGVFTAKKK